MYFPKRYSTCSKTYSTVHSLSTDLKYYFHCTTHNSHCPSSMLDRVPAGLSHNRPHTRLGMLCSQMSMQCAASSPSSLCDVSWPGRVTHVTLCLVFWKSYHGVAKGKAVSVWRPISFYFSFNLLIILCPPFSDSYSRISPTWMWESLLYYWQFSTITFWSLALVEHSDSHTLCLMGEIVYWVGGRRSLRSPDKKSFKSCFTPVPPNLFDHLEN